jgi:hypothetical protein
MMELKEDFDTYIPMPLSSWVGLGMITTLESIDGSAIIGFPTKSSLMLVTGWRNHQEDRVNMKGEGDHSFES